MKIRTSLLSSTFAVLVVGALAAGCSGSSSSGGSGTSAPAATDTGELTLAVTDAATDEIDVFEVDIVAFRFQRSDGASVEVLPQTARVDFAQLVSVSEVIAAASLPVGTYTQAFMTLDFGGAMVRINGSSTPATLVDSNGAPLSGRQELQIHFPNGGFAVGARKGYFAEVDFDLDQSLMVDAAANKVEVDSVFFASINPAQPKAARVPGLASGFTTSASFALDVRRGLGLVSRGTLTVSTGPATVFNLDGQVLTGQAGFDALQAKGDDTLIVTKGEVNPLSRTQTATEVVLLPQDLDEVGGLVVARSAGPGQDATLTLRGVAVRRGAGSVTFNDTVTIQTSLAETKVAKRGVQGGTLTTDAINVGQRILAYGRFSGSTLDLTQSGAGFVRLIVTDLQGAAAAPPNGSLSVDVTRIGRRSASAFDLNVGGVVQGDLDGIVCSTGGLSLASITSGSPVVVRGFFAPVSSATPTGATFTAESVVDRTDAASLLRLRWVPAATAPIQSGGALSFDVSNALVKSIDRGLVAPTTLAQSPTLVGDGSSGFFAIRQGFTLTLFNTFANWEAELRKRIDAGAGLRHVRAVGRWTDASKTLSAKRAVAVLTP